jgi:hypothetical protein
MRKGYIFLFYIIINLTDSGEKSNFCLVLILNLLLLLATKDEMI